MHSDLISKIDSIKLTDKRKDDMLNKISSWASLHRLINNNLSALDCLVAIKVEMETKKRYAIIKRLHQRYTRIKAKIEFSEIEKRIN